MKRVANPTKICGFRGCSCRFAAIHDALPRCCHVMFVSRLFSSSSSTVHGSFCRGCQHPKKNLKCRCFSRHAFCIFSLKAVRYIICISTPQVVSFVISGLLAAVTDFIPWKLRELPPSETQTLRRKLMDIGILVASPSQ